jgi:hypothetical protein
MNVDDRKLRHGRGRGGGVAGRVAGRGRGRGGRVDLGGRVRGRTATESSWFGNAVDPVPIVPLPPLDVHGYSSDEDEEEDDGWVDHDDEWVDHDDERVDHDDGIGHGSDDEPEVYREGLRRDFKYNVDVSQVSFPCKTKADLLAHFFQAKAGLSRRQLTLFTMYVNDPWVRESGLTYENGKQLIDDAVRLFPMFEAVYVKTTLTKIVASKGSVNRQRGEKRTREISIKVKQFRVPDVLERTIANPKKSQFLKAGVKINGQANTEHNGATEYRDSLHAFNTQDHRDSDSTSRVTPNGEFWVISPSRTI